MEGGNPWLARVPMNSLPPGLVFEALLKRFDRLRQQSYSVN